MNELTGPQDLVKMQILIPEARAGAWDSASPTSSQGTDAPEVAQRTDM